MSDASSETNLNDGGPAFPSDVRDIDGAMPGHDPVCTGQHRGMSLRDWFAGMAMSGGMADSSYVADAHSRAMTAYEVADAMLIARSPNQ